MTRLRLTVVAGGEPGRAWEVTQGVTQHVGGSAAADVVLGGDEEVAATHCALYWVGDECRVRNLGAGGTWVNGAAVHEQALRSGDIVQCGRTQLRGEYVAEVERGVESGEGDPKARALEVLRGLPGKLYAVLDAARDPEVLQLLRRSGYRYECLWGGWGGEVYGAVAPYLVRLRKDGRLLEQLVERGWGKGWGIFIESDASFSTVRSKARSLLQARLDSSEVALFRWYDPEVFEGFFKVATDDQRAEVLLAGSRYFVESPSSLASLTRSSRDGQAV